MKPLSQTHAEWATDENTPNPLLDWVDNENARYKIRYTEAGTWECRKKFDEKEVICESIFLDLVKQEADIDHNREVEKYIKKELDMLTTARRFMETLGD